MAERIQLNDQDVTEVVGGAFNWYKKDGARRCKVTNFGDYFVTDTAKTRYTSLKLEHKADGWTDADYAQQLIDEGEFF